MSPASRIVAAIAGVISVVALISRVPDLLRVIRSTRILLAVDISSVIQPSRKKEATG